MRVRLSRTEQTEQNRERVLEAARRVFLARGFHTATLDQIAEEAGFSKGAFYSNFSSKEDIFLQLLGRNAGGDVSELEGRLGGIDDPRDIIESLSAWANARASDHRWGVLAIEMMRRARREETMSERHVKLFHDQWVGVGEILIRKLFPEGDPPTSAFNLGGIVLELTYGGIGNFLDAGSPGEMVRVALSSMYEAHTLRRPQRPKRTMSVELREGPSELGRKGISGR
jgi:AcrR family transcriptional regulator